MRGDNQVTMRRDNQVTRDGMLQPAHLRVRLGVRVGVRVRVRVRGRGRGSNARGSTRAAACSQQPALAPAAPKSGQNMR